MVKVVLVFLACAGVLSCGPAVETSSLPYLPTPPPPPWEKKPVHHMPGNGIAVEPGAMAGTWALVIEFSTIVTVPLFGDRPGGSKGLRLVTRTWDPDREVYAEEFRWCADDIYAVQGSQPSVDDATLHSLAPVQYSATADHPNGTYLASVLDVWGARNLPDPMHTDLPTSQNYTDPPRSDWMWDEDGDGHPGVTIHMHGTISGDGYVVSRSAYSLQGAIVALDRIQGVARSSKSEQHTVASTNRWMVGESRVRPDPELTNSWFQMVRLADGATCDDVLEARGNGTLADSNPL